jgi:hypothetical protein
MDDIARFVVLWKHEFLITLGVLACVGVVYYGRRIWVTEEGVTLTSVLGVGLAALVTLCFASHPLWAFHISDRAALFLMLFLWSSLGLIFIAARQTHIIKLLIGLASQGAIIYALFRYV